MRRLETLPGWRSEYGVDFSGYPIAGTSCANCRALYPTPVQGFWRCTSPSFIAQSIHEQGKRRGVDIIPVESGDPSKYCCNAWALSEGLAQR